MSAIRAVDPEHPLADAFDAATRRGADCIRAAGVFDSYFGRRLPGLLARVGLVEVGNEAVAQVVRGGEPWALYIKKGQESLDPTSIARGALTERDIAERDRALGDPSFEFMRGLIVAAWGQRSKQLA